MGRVGVGAAEQPRELDPLHRFVAAWCQALSRWASPAGGPGASSPCATASWIKASVPAAQEVEPVNDPVGANVKGAESY